MMLELLKRFDAKRGWNLFPSELIKSLSASAPRHYQLTRNIKRFYQIRSDTTNTLIVIS